MLLVQFSSVARSCLTLCHPMECSMSGLPVYHQLLELTQTHVHRVSDTIQPSHPLLSPSPPTFNLSQHQGLCKWVSSSHQVPKYWSFGFSISPSNEYSGLISFTLGLTGLLYLQSKGLSRVFSNTRVQKHQFFGAQLSLHKLTYVIMLEQFLKSWNEVKIAQLCQTLCDPMDYTIHGILQARILEWVAFPYSSRSS